MAKLQWFRNAEWNADIEAEFRKRLGRARDKSQYLRIQALHLVDSHPHIAHALLDEYFALDDDSDSDFANALGARAEAHLALGDIEAALQSYEAVLERERRIPKIRTAAYLRFACLVANARTSRLYTRALQVLDDHLHRLHFPVEIYRYYGARAIILAELGRTSKARQAAGFALAAATESRPDYRYHQYLLVKNFDDDFGRRIAEIAE